MATTLEDLLGVRDVGADRASDVKRDVDKLLEVETDPEKISILNSIQNSAQQVIDTNNAYFAAEEDDSLDEMDWDAI